MALLDAVFGKRKNVVVQTTNEDGTQREFIVFDATLNVSHQNDAEPTEHPVEDGSLITDHVDLMPKVISMEVIISRTPLDLRGALVGNVSGAVPAIAGFGGTLAGTLFTGVAATLGGQLLNAGGNRVETALNSLLELQEKKIPVTVITGLRAYNSMILKNFNPVENAQNGDSLRFTATWKEIKIAQSEQIVLPAGVLDAAVANKAASKQSIGKKVANDSTKGASLLSRLTGIGG